MSKRILEPIIEEEDILIHPSKKLKKAPINRRLGWSQGTIEKTSGRIINGSITARVLSGVGPNKEPPGSIVHLPPDMRVAVPPKR